MVKTRYLQTAQSATAEQTGEDSLFIEFDSPQRAITPGQAAELSINQEPNNILVK
ncbi:MAG: hypothetical protein FWB89_09005 [Treponema sp.]|nr:hypothetical protein [Treponema sp.]